MSAPTCSICIANYNGESLLADCIDSILAQDCDFAFEILVHDDASTDASLALLRERYPQVEVIASTTNVGFCVANNRLADRARGDYLLLLNNDAALAPDALSTLLAQARLQSPPGILTLPQYDWESGSLVDRGCLLDPFYNTVPNLDPDRRDVAMVIGACLWIPRVLWHELGGFPEWFESIAEDTYLCCRARLAGHPVQAAAYSSYRHRQGKSFGGNRPEDGRLSSTYRRRRLSERNKTFVLTVCTPTPWMWPLLLLHLILLAMEGGLLTLLKRQPRVWRDIYGNAVGRIASSAGLLLRLRREVQGSRACSALDYARTFVAIPRKVQLALRHGIPGLQ